MLIQTASLRGVAMTTTEIFEKFSAIDDGHRLLRLSLEDHMHAIESAKMGIVDSLRWMAENKADMMKGLDREQDAYDEGRRAAMRGETLSQYQPSYRRRPELWTRFQLGFLDAIRDMRRAKAKESKKHVR